MKRKPLVSLICAAKNESETLDRCVKSILGQTIQDIEMILVDDHSDDETLETMKKMAELDSRVRVVKNEMKPGLTYSLNLGLDFARGKYVARIDADDFAHKDRLKLQVEMIESYESAVMIAGGYRVIDDDDRELYCYCPSCDPKMLKWSLCLSNKIRHSTALWKRELDVRYEPSFTHAQDYEMWRVISRLGEIRVVPEIICTVRRRSNSITATRHEDQERMADKVARSQYEYYTDKKMMADRQARVLRLLHHLKSPEQFKTMENISPFEFCLGLEMYFRMAECFSKKETPDMEKMESEMTIDIKSLLANEERRSDTKICLESLAEFFGDNSLAKKIRNKLVSKHS